MCSLFFILFRSPGLPSVILSPTAVKQMPFSYPPRVIRIPHFLWLGTGGVISWDRWEPDRNNWCRLWKRAPTKHPLFFEKWRNIQWKFLAALAYIPNSEWWCLGNKVKTLGVQQEEEGEVGLRLVRGEVILITSLHGKRPKQSHVNEQTL